MKHRVSELEGALLDAAVAKAEGYLAPVIFATDEGEPAARWMPHPTLPHHPVEDWSPSTTWVQGGPIIERERIELQNHAASDGWWAGVRQPPDQNRTGGTVCTGPTPLVAAMRAYVASKFGQEIEL